MHEQDNQRDQSTQRTQSVANQGGSSNGTFIQAPSYQVNAATQGDGDPGCDCYTNIKDVIQQQVDAWGTDEEAIYAAIRQCPMREKLKGDMYALKDLRSEMGGHDLWKAYLLITYGTEANFPQEINDIWDATKGMGTDEDKVFKALESMDAQTRNTFGLGYILKAEMSGDDLTKALGIMNQRSHSGDSIQGNIFGDPGAERGVHDFVINTDNAVELIGAEFQGAGTQSLTQAMMDLYDPADASKVDSALGVVATSRGITVDQAKTQYAFAISKRKAGIAYYKNNKFKKEHPELVWDENIHSPAPALTAENMPFTATNAQLAFGKIVGDVFGIDAVFGSIMSPTGGMAGGGNDRVMGVANGSAIALHGAVHDAGGYLKNCFDIGPGYDYFQNEAGSDPTHHLAGQTNIRWWIEQYEAKGIERGAINGRYQSFLANNAYKGAAFAKDFTQLNLEQKKEVLGIIVGTNTIILNQLDIDNDDRVAEVQEMMDLSSDEDRVALANHYYENDQFGSILAASAINRIMKPHVDQDVYDDYLARMMSGY